MGQFLFFLKLFDDPTLNQLAALGVNRMGDVGVQAGMVSRLKNSLLSQISTTLGAEI